MCDEKRNGNVPEAKEPLTLKVFLAGSTQDRGYSLAESIIDSVATSLAYEWRESVESFGKKGVVLPQIVVRTAESSQRQDVLTKHIEESDVVLFFLDSFRKPGAILRREMDEALGSFLRTGRPRSYYFLREHPSYFFSAPTSRPSVDPSKYWPAEICDSIERHGFFQGREYISYDGAHIDGYLQELSVILVRAMVEKRLRRENPAREELGIAEKMKHNIRCLVAHLEPREENVPEPGKQPEDECFEVMRLSGAIDDDADELRISNAELARRFYKCVEKWAWTEEPSDEPDVEDEAATKSWCSVEVAGIRVLLCGETSNRAREFARETLRRIDGTVVGIESHDESTDERDKPYDVAMFFLDDLKDHPDCELVIRQTAKQFLEQGWPYPYLFLEENAKDDGTTRENLQKCLDKYGFMQYCVGYSRDDVAGYMSELLKIVASALIEKTCYEPGMGLFAHFPLQVPSHVHDHSDGQTLAKILFDKMQKKDGQSEEALDGRTVRQLLYLVNYLLYKSDLDVGLKMHKTIRGKSSIQGIEISGRDKRSISVYLSWAAHNTWHNNHIRVFFRDGDAKNRDAKRRLDILVGKPIDGPGKVLRHLYTNVFLPWANNENCFEGDVKVYLDRSWGENGQLAPIAIQAKGGKGMSYGSLSESQMDYLTKSPFLSWISNSGGDDEGEGQKRQLDILFIRHDDKSREVFERLYAIAKTDLAGWLMSE